MALFPQSFIDDLKLQADIVQVIQEYVPLKKADRATKDFAVSLGEDAVFHVNRDKGFFHCFGCGAAAMWSSFWSFRRSWASRTRYATWPRSLG